MNFNKIKIKNFIKSAARKFGLDLRTVKVSTDPIYQLLALIELVKINTVLDVGANTGQFARSLRQAGYKEKIISFEPLSTEHEILKKVSQKDNNWIIHDRTAIGAEDGFIQINRSENSVSSSILEISQQHIDAQQNSKYVSFENTPIARLDTIMPQYQAQISSCLLKMDVQGYEWYALKGASRLLSRVKVVVCELSLVPLYKGQKLWNDVFELMNSFDLDLWAIQPGLNDPKTGRTLQFDAVFLRKDEKIGLKISD